MRAMLPLTAVAAAISLVPQSNYPQQPIPELAKAYSEYKFVGAGPLPLREAKEDWAAARRRLKSDAAVAAWVAGRQKHLDIWTKRHRDRAEWTAGWGHDLVDPKTMLPVVWSWDMAEPPNATPEERKVHGAWVFYERDANVHSVLEAVQLWRLTGNAADLSWAISQLDFYAEAYASWPLQRAKGYSRMFGQNLDEATDGIVLANAVRLIGEEASPDQRRRWREGLFAPMLSNIRSSNRGDNNIAVWQAGASAVLAIELGDTKAYAEAIDGSSGLRSMLGKGVTRDYLWFEPSVAYGQYTQRALASAFTYLSLLQRARDLRREMLLSQDMIAATAAMRFADGTLPAVGDSAPGIRAFDPSLISMTQRTMPVRSPALPLGWDTLLDPDMQQAPPPDEAGTRVWPSWQAAMLRHDGWELFAGWGQLSASHAQSDALSYELRYEGVAVTGSAGTANYGSPLFLKYLRTGVAHNVPLIDGVGQTRFGVGELVRSDRNEVVARHPGFGDAKVERDFDVHPGTATIRTSLTVADPRRLGDSFSTACAVSPNIRLSPASTPEGPGFEWLTKVMASGATSQGEALLDCSGRKVRLAFASDTPGTLYVSAAPDRTGRPVRTSIYFESRTKALRTEWRFTAQ